jgi:hypothetical protein
MLLLILVDLCLCFCSNFFSLVHGMLRGMMEQTQEDHARVARDDRRNFGSCIKR